MTQVLHQWNILHIFTLGVDGVKEWWSQPYEFVQFVEILTPKYFLPSLVHHGQAVGTCKHVAEPINFSKICLGRIKFCKCFVADGRHLCLRKRQLCLSTYSVVPHRKAFCDQLSKFVSTKMLNASDPRIEHLPPPWSWWRGLLMVNTIMGRYQHNTTH